MNNSIDCSNETGIDVNHTTDTTDKDCVISPSNGGILSLTNAAMQRIHTLRAIRNTHNAGLRVEIRKGGCAGMEYHVDMVDSPLPDDEVVQLKDVWVSIAPTAIMFLIGSTIDYISTLLESGFKFNNPNVQEACGCGLSVKFTPSPGDANK